MSILALRGGEVGVGERVVGEADWVCLARGCSLDEFSMLEMLAVLGLLGPGLFSIDSRLADVRSESKDGNDLCEPRVGSCGRRSVGDSPRALHCGSLNNDPFEGLNSGLTVSNLPSLLTKPVVLRGT